VRRAQAGRFAATCGSFEVVYEDAHERGAPAKIPVVKKLLISPWRLTLRGCIGLPGDNNRC
jgi:hypothetical protein